MQLYLLLNNDCNLKCGFCIRGYKSSSNYIDIEILRGILRKNNFSKYHLLLTGGEPTLHPDLNEIIDMCQPAFKSISINTNGLESSWIDQCKEKNIHVQISLDGTKSMHNQLRGNGKIDVYSKIMETIKILNSFNISYNISTTVGKNNYDNVRNLCKYMREFSNIRYWKVSPLLPFGCADENNVIAVSEWNDLVNYLLDNAEVRLQIKRLFDFDLLDRYMEKNPDILKLQKSNCGNVKYKVYVYSDFTVYPCTCLTDFPLGNLKYHTLNELIDSTVGKMFSNYSVKEQSVCYQCKYLPICNGGCIGMSYHYFKELGMGDYRCNLIQKELHTIV